MIDVAMEFLGGEVEQFLVDQQGAPKGLVVVDNIAELSTNNALTGHIVATVVNIEEESALKNGRFFNRKPGSNALESLSPPIYLNLYVLFAVPPLQGGYLDALKKVSGVIELFQAKRAFTVENSTAAVPRGGEDFVELRLHPELYTLTFEQSNHLWGTLGGKQLPSVLYKVRLVKIQSRVTMEAPLIETIDADFHSVGSEAPVTN